MCSIFGIYSPNNNLEKDPIEIMENLKINTSHRGKDFSNYLSINKGLYLGHNRLKIVDKSNYSNQPFFDKENGDYLTFNGEIYNYKQIKNRYATKGDLSRKSSDTEVLFKIFKKYKKEALNLIDGMYSFAFWDSDLKKIYLVRDPLGIKPLFYVIQNNQLFFSSEAKSLAKSLNIKPNYKKYLDFLAYGFIPGNNTFFDSINVLPPGHILEFGPKFFSIEKLNQISKSESYDSISYQIEKSIELQSSTEVKTGIFLSGGLDSSSIAAVASIANKKLLAYTASYKTKNKEILFLNKDSRKAIKTAQDHKIKIKNVIINSEQIPDLMFELFSKIDQPILDPALIVSFALSKEAKQDNVKVVLSGIGGDELFFGYDRYYNDVRNLINKLTFLKSIFRNILKVEILPVSFLEKIARLSSIEIDMCFSTTGAHKILWKNKKLFLDFIKRDQEAIFWNCGQCKNFMKFRNFDLSNYLSSHLLYGLDQTLMLNTIEGRVPLLGQKVVNYSLDNSFINLKNKKPIRNLISKKSPLYKPLKKKLGFGGTISDWVKTNREFFISNAKQAQKNFDGYKYNVNLDDLNLDNIHNDMTIYALASLNIWMNANWE